MNSEARGGRPPLWRLILESALVGAVIGFATAIIPRLLGFHLDPALAGVAGGI